MRIFVDNLRIAEELQLTGTSTHGVTQFMDLTPDEFKSMYTGFDVKALRAALGDLPIAQPIGAGTPPAAVDWRTKGVVTAVKDQGQCGSCWAFSVTEQTETNFKMNGGSLLELSPQQIVDCDKQDQGCNGGQTTLAWEYIHKYGLQTESSYPYTSGLAAAEFPGFEDGSGKCHYNSKDVAVNITGYKYGTTGGNENLMQSNMATLGPFSVCVATNGWQSYTGGIMSAGTCGTQVDHCVQAVGYNTGGGSGNYWIVRNSWATSWGIAGYIYVELGSNACDITSTVTYAQTMKA